MDITTIIEAAAALVAAVITAVVIPYIKSRTTAQQQAEINAWVKIAVTAAEQIYRGSGRGDQDVIRTALDLELVGLHVEVAECILVKGNRDGLFLSGLQMDTGEALQLPGRTDDLPAGQADGSRRRSGLPSLRWWRSGSPHRDPLGIRWWPQYRDNTG